jgi:hypothetical protein
MLSALFVGYQHTKEIAMFKTASNPTRPATVRLSDVTTDPVLAAFFQRGESDTGAAFAVPTSPKPALVGGAAAKVPEYA